MIWRDHKIPPDNWASPVSYEEWARPFTRFICSTCLDKQLLRRWIFLLIHASRIISFHQSRISGRSKYIASFTFSTLKASIYRRTLPIQSQKCIGQIFQKFFPENKSDDPYGRPRDSVCIYEVHGLLTGFNRLWTDSGRARKNKIGRVKQAWCGVIFPFQTTLGYLRPPVFLPSLQHNRIPV